MSDFYEGLRDNTAAPLIRQYGKPITLLRTTGAGSYDPTTGDIDSAGTIEEHAGYAVESNYSAALVDSSAIATGDRRLLCVDIPRPVPGDDTLKVGSREYSIVNVNPVSPGEVEIMYEVQAR